MNTIGERKKMKRTNKHNPVWPVQRVLITQVEELVGEHG